MPLIGRLEAAMLERGNATLSHRYPGYPGHYVRDLYLNLRMASLHELQSKL
jgi:hypothetical protein